MLGNIRQRLSDDEVRDGFGLLREAPRQIDVQRVRTTARGPPMRARRPGPDRTESPERFPHDIASLRQRGLRVASGLSNHRALAVDGQCRAWFAPGRRHRQRHQPRLHTVMQIAFDAVSLGLRRATAACLAVASA